MGRSVCKPIGGLAGAVLALGIGLGGSVAHAAPAAGAQSGEQNPVVALERYRLAAAQGDSAALNGLGGMFEKGNGVAADLTTAYALYHLAAEKHAPSRDDPRRVLRVNVEGSHDLFALAARVGVGKTVFSSSLYAHGRRHLPPLHEDDRPSPTTVYGLSKLAGEHLLGHFAARGEFACTALRLFFVFGPRQYAGAGYKSVIIKNFERLLTGQSPVIRGDGQQTLDYVYVDDVVDALVSALRPAADGMTLHVGSGRGVSIEELTTTMCQIAGADERPVREAPDDTAGTQRVCAPGRASACLGWTPKVTIEEGLRRVHDWLRSAAR